MSNPRINRFARLAATLLASAVCSASAWAAISVTDISVSLNGKTSVHYRLNEAATSVDIAVTTIGGTQHYTGPTALGMNTWDYPGGIAPIGATAIITATGNPVNGAGGAVMLFAPIQPPGRVGSATSPTGTLMNIGVNKRQDSPKRGHIFTVTGFGTTANDQKYLTEYDAGGIQVISQNIGGGTNGYGITSSSYPYGVAVALNDPLDRVYMNNRSTRTIQVANSDLSKGPTLTNANYNAGAGIAVVPKGPNAAADATYTFNIYQSDNWNPDATGAAGIYHYQWDGTGLALVRPNGNNADGTQVAVAQVVPPGVSHPHTQDIAVDATSSHLYKVVVPETAADIAKVSLTTTDASGNYALLNHWTSSDDGVTLTLDNAWAAGFVAAVGTDAATVIATGISLDKDFDPNNLSGSAVWVGVTSNAATAAPFINRLYRVNASSGAILATIDLTLVETVAGGPDGVNGANNSVHYIEANAAGNVVVTLNTDKAPQAQPSRYFTVVAPNSATGSTDTTPSFPLTPGFDAEVKVDHPVVGNSGAASTTLTYTATVFNVKGIVEDATTVTADLTAIGAGATESIPRTAVDASGKIGTFQKTFTLPDGQAPGSFPLPFSVKSASDTTGILVRVNQTIYQAYKYDWKTPVSGAVSTSPATNGTVAFIGTDSGNLYAIDTATGAKVSGFGAGGVVNLGEPLKNEIVSAFGRLFVVGSSKVFILKNATVKNGAPLVATSPALTSPRSVALSPDGAKLFVSAGNKILTLDPATGASLGIESEDLGAAVNKIAVGPSEGLFGDYLVVAGTDVVTPATGTPYGQIVMLAGSNLSAAFTNTDFTPVVIQDTTGAVKSRPVFGKTGIGGLTANIFVVGGATGVFGINADLGAKIDWPANGGGGANVGGNPYQMGTPVLANVGLSTQYSASTTPTLRTPNVFVATRGDADNGGLLLNIAVADGTRASFGGYPVSLTPKGSGFAEGAGILNLWTRYITEPAGESNPIRSTYLGSDAVDQRFFGIQTTPDDTGYSATPARVQIFDPKDATSFPGETAGAFNSTPAYGAAKVIIGSSAGMVYGFPLLYAGNLATPIYVTDVSPANGQDGVPTAAAPVIVTFSSQVSAASVSPLNVLLYEGGTQVSTDIAVPDAAKNTITITPFGDLKTNTWYTVVVLGDVLGANASVLTQPFSSSFYTGTIAPPAHDVNGDGIFNLEDVKSLLRITGGLETASAQAKTQGDVAAPTGQITVEDALALRKLLP